MFLALVPLLYAASTSALAPANMRLQYLGSRDGGVASLSNIDPYLNSLYLSVEVADERKLNEYILQIESTVVKKKLLTATEYQALSHGRRQGLRGDGRRWLYLRVPQAGARLEESQCETHLDVPGLWRVGQHHEQR